MTETAANETANKTPFKLLGGCISQFFDATLPESFKGISFMRLLNFEELKGAFIVFGPDYNGTSVCAEMIAYIPVVYGMLNVNSISFFQLRDDKWVGLWRNIEMERHIEICIRNGTYSLTSI